MATIGGLPTAHSTVNRYFSDMGMAWQSQFYYSGLLPMDHHQFKQRQGSASNLGGMAQTFLTTAHQQPIIFQGGFPVQPQMSPMCLPRQTLSPVPRLVRFATDQTDAKEDSKRLRCSLDSSGTVSDSESDEDSSIEKSSSSTESARVKGPWTTQEDKRLRELVGKFGQRWSVVAEGLPGRIGKQCRERWLNHLNTTIKHTPWTPVEDAILLAAHKTQGNRWAQIAKLLPGRPENSVKNRYTSLVHKQSKIEHALRRAATRHSNKASV